MEDFLFRDIDFRHCRRVFGLYFSKGGGGAEGLGRMRHGWPVKAIIRLRRRL